MGRHGIRAIVHADPRLRRVTACQKLFVVGFWKRTLNHRYFTG
jgi:hypothetical protein